MLFKIEKKLALNSKISIGLLLLICILCLAPFANKAFHIDDPLFIWAAKQIQTNPFDFYGFIVNWYGSDMLMSEITKNPPLASFYIALVAFFFGWNEIALHLAFLIPACAVVIGTYYLAKELCDNPFLATLSAISTPVFLLSSTTVMCDTLMLSFWVWAIYLWLRGTKTNNSTNLTIAAFLIAACSLTKYFGMALIPLLIAYSFAEKRKLGRWILFLFIPVLILAAYQWATYALYGRGLLLDAVTYSTSTRAILSGNFMVKILTGLAFTGGCLIPVLFYAPLLWSKRVLVVSAMLILFSVLMLQHFTTTLNFPISNTNGHNWLYAAQFLLLLCAGVCFFSILINEGWRHRDADSILLLLWAMGTLVFAIFINWTINGRSILPLVPAFGILLVRHLSRQRTNGSNTSFWRFLLPLVPALIIALLVTWADYRLATTSRTAAVTIYNTYKGTTGTVWFQGHWGFQYYMERLGAKALDFRRPTFNTGDIIIVPFNNTNIKPMPEEWFALMRKFQFSTDRLLTTMNSTAGAGFYSDVFGPVPFVVGLETSEEYYVFRALK